MIHYNFNNNNNYCNNKTIKKHFSKRDIYHNYSNNSKILNRGQVVSRSIELILFESKSIQIRNKIYGIL